MDLPFPSATLEKRKPVRLSMSEKLWEPSEEQIENANLTDFMSYLGETSNVSFDDYDKLWEWSEENRVARGK